MRALFPSDFKFHALQQTHVIFRETAKCPYAEGKYRVRFIAALHGHRRMSDQDATYLAEQRDNTIAYRVTAAVWEQAKSGALNGFALHPDNDAMLLVAQTHAPYSLAA